MRVLFDGKEYKWDGLSLAEARLVQAETGMVPSEWYEALSRKTSDPRAVTCLIQILRRRDGEPDLLFEQVDGPLDSLVYLSETDDPPDENEADDPKEQPANG